MQRHLWPIRQGPILVATVPFEVGAMGQKDLLHLVGEADTCGPHRQKGPSAARRDVGVSGGGVLEPERGMERTLMVFPYPPPRQDRMRPPGPSHRTASGAVPADGNGPLAGGGGVVGLVMGGVRCRCPARRSADRRPRPQPPPPTVPPPRLVRGGLLGGDRRMKGPGAAAAASPSPGSDPVRSGCRTFGEFVELIATVFQ